MTEEITHNEKQELSKDIVKVSSEESCFNCKNNLQSSDLFCSHCGQKRGNQRHSFWSLIHDFLSDFFNWDSKFIRSIVPLAIKPGKLTNEFILGRRIRYVPPIRLYVFLSFIYFFIISITGNQQKLFESDAAGNSIASFDISDGDSTITTSIFDLQVLEETDLIELQNFKDSIYYNLKNNLDTTQYNKWKSILLGWSLLSKGVESDEIIDSLGITNIFEQQVIIQSQKLKDNPKNYANNAIKNISILLFVLMPIFALILKLLYVRRNFFYTEHLIFSFHAHAFMFLVLLAILFVSKVPLLTVLLILYIWVYLFFALKRVYKQGFFKTAIKYFMLQSLYTVALIIGIVVTFVITFYLF